MTDDPDHEAVLAALRQVAEQIEEHARSIPPGVVGSVGAVVRNDTESDGSAISLVVIVSPFSEFAEVEDWSWKLFFGDPENILLVLERFDRRQSVHRMSRREAQPEALRGLAEAWGRDLVSEFAPGLPADH